MAPCANPRRLQGCRYKVSQRLARMDEYAIPMGMITRGGLVLQLRRVHVPAAIDILVLKRNADTKYRVFMQTSDNLLGVALRAPKTIHQDAEHTRFAAVAPTTALRLDVDAVVLIQSLPLKLDYANTLDSERLGLDSQDVRPEALADRARPAAFIAIVRGHLEDE